MRPVVFTYYWNPVNMSKSRLGLHNSSAENLRSSFLCCFQLSVKGCYQWKSPFTVSIDEDFNSGFTSAIFPAQSQGNGMLLLGGTFLCISLGCLPSMWTGCSCPNTDFMSHWRIHGACKSSVWLGRQPQASQGLWWQGRSTMMHLIWPKGMLYGLKCHKV